MAKEALTGGGKGVCIEKSLDDGVIVARLEVIPASVGWVVVSFSCYSGDKAVEKVVFISVFLVAGFLAGTTIQGLA